MDLYCETENFGEKDLYYEMGIGEGRDLNCEMDLG